MKPVNAWKKPDGAERYESVEKSLKAGNDTSCARANGGGTVETLIEAETTEGEI